MTDTIPEQPEAADNPERLVRITWLIDMRLTDFKAAAQAAIEAIANTEGLDDEERAERFEDLTNGIDVIAFELVFTGVQPEPELPGFELDATHMHVDLVQSESLS